MELEHIDNLVKYLYHKGPVYTKYRDIIAEHFKYDEKAFDIDGMLIKLDKDGFVDTGKFKLNSKHKLGWTQQTVYKLSFEGRMKFEGVPEEFKGKPYQYQDFLRVKRERADRIEKWPKRNWILVAVITYIVGVTTTVITSKLQSKPPEPTTEKSTQSVSKQIDSFSKK